jgi:uncharacterized protein YegP (UPF0339 family)
MVRKVGGLVTGLVLGTIIGGSVAGLSAQAKKDEPKPAAGFTFEVYKDKGEKYRFRFVEGDDNLAMASRGYETKEEVMKVIETIKKEAAKAKVAEEKKGK